MITQKSIKNALRKVADSHIYTRGVGYYSNGRVKDFSSEKEGDTIITVIGKVKGSRMYHVTLTFNNKNEEFLEIICSCPYGDVCKHAVALGLAVANSLQEKQLEPFDKEQARKMLANMGLSVENTPDSLIENLLKYRTSQSKIKASQKKSASQPFNPLDYFFKIQRYNGFKPTFYDKRCSYRETSISKLLKRKDLSDNQRKLLQYIEDGEKPDLSILFPLLVQAGFPIYEYYSYSDKNPLIIDIHPEKLQGEIVYEPTTHHSDKNLIRHDFFFRVPNMYWPKNGIPWFDSPFIRSNACIVRDIKDENKLDLHQVTPLLANLFSRLEPVFETESYKHKIDYYQTRLDIQELAHFDELISDASSMLDLTSAPPLFGPKKITSMPQSSFNISFDNAEQTLRIMPIVDYSIYKQDISESVYLSRTNNGDKLRRREVFANPGSHIISVTDGCIYYTPIDEKKEIAFYKSLIRNASKLGFTKTLKYQRKGEKQIFNFLEKELSVVSDYAKKNGYPIFYEKDLLSTESELFRADFEADLNADSDWLYFDVECYCGGERITLERLFAFIESKEHFWRKEDGTLVEITNRDELERLAKLLKSFHARENGGFEGRLYHASELEYVMTSSKHYSALRAKSFKQFMNHAKKGRPVHKVQLPKSLISLLRPYQKEGIDWFYFLRTYRFAGILADDMGLGKTLQTLSVLYLERIAGKPSLVVCPKTLLYNWQKEIERFFPELNVLVYDGTREERQQKSKYFSKYDIIIASYNILKQDETVFLEGNIQFNYAVLDEAQFIKNHATKNSQVVKKLNADYRLALTGTPLENNVSELWSIFDFLMPDFLGKIDHFTKHFHKPIMDGGDKNALEYLQSKVKPFMLRRTKSEVLKELPPKIEQTSLCQLTEEQNVLYQQILQKVRGDVLAAVKKKGFQSSQIHILAGLTKLRQACNHPALLTKDKNFHKYESAKLNLCMQLVDEVVESGRKVLIFSQFTSMLDILTETLKNNNVSHLYLSGKTKDRQELVDEFNTDLSIPVFLISLKAGGTGLNLTSADTVIIFDPWWNPSVENQAIDRTHRIGQTKSVNVYRLLTIGTIEEKIQTLKQKKKHLFDSMVDETGDTLTKLTWEDIKKLFA